MKTAICIYYKNKKQVKWWNKIGSKLVRWDFLGNIADETTGEICGCLMEIRGLFKKLVERKNISFIPNQKTIIFRKSEL